MKTSIRLIVILAALCTTAVATPPSGYYQVWNDEFDGSDLSGSKWTKFTGSHRDAVNTTAAIDVGSSIMTITTYTTSGTHNSGFIGTQGKFYSKFGYYEAYIDWNDSAGMWSAFWLQADPMDDCPYPASHQGDTLTYGAEIDIVEHRSQDSSANNIANQAVSNIHWDGYTGFCAGLDTSTGSGLVGSGLNSGYHTYGLLWDSSNYRFYVDDSQVFSTGSGNSEHSEWIVLSSEVQNGGWSGSTPSSYGTISSSTTKMRVAYVRYYVPNNTVFWDGSSSSSWTNTANWVAGKSVPNSGTVVFSLLGTGNFSTQLGQDFTLDTLTILETSPITISSNRLTLNNLLDMNSAWNSATINSDLVLGNANTWRIGGGRTLNVNGNISGGHSLTLDGYGTAVLNASNSYTLGTTVNRGTLRISNDSALGSTNVGTTVANDATLLVYANINCLEPLSLDGAGPALRVGNSANATWSGAITLANAATIKLDGGTTLNVAGNITGAHTLTLAADAGGTGTVSGPITTSAFTVNKSGAGTWTLAGSNTFTGALNVDTASTSADDGVLRITSSAAIGNAGSIQIRNNSGAGASSTLQLDGVVSAAQAIALNGRNNTVPSIQNVSGSNSLSGTITINAGGSDYRIQSDAGLLTLAGRIASAVSSARTFTLQGAGDTLVSGVISNGSSSLFHLTKSGTGTATLSGANTYNGATTISGGTLALAPGGSIAGSATISVNAALDASAAGGLTVNAGQLLGGNGVVIGNVTVANGATISAGNSPGTLSLSNNLTLAGGATCLFDLVNVAVEGGGTNDEIVVAGNVSLSGTNTISINPISGLLANGRYVLIRYGGTLTGGAANLAVMFTGAPPQAGLALDVSVSGEIALVVAAFPGSLIWRGDGGSNRWDAGLSTNWFDGASNTVFSPGDSVTFDDTSTNLTVRVTGAVAPGLIVIGGTNNYTFTGSGTISGVTGILKTNTATLSVLTTNAHTGTTEIDAGTLTVSGSLGSGNIINNSVLIYNYTTTQTVAGAISGTGSLTKLGSGVLVLTGSNGFSGGTTLSVGSLVASNSGALGTGPLTLNNNATQVVFATDVVLTNAITVSPGSPSGAFASGILKGPTAGTATLSGPMTITASTVSGGHFDGGNLTGGLVVSGAITSSVAVRHRANRVTFAGGGVYDSFQSEGTTVLGADNGLATNCVANIGFNGSAGILDLAGFNQTLNGLVKGSQPATVGNSSTNSDSLLTIKGTNSTYAGAISNAVSGGSRKVFLTVAGGTFTLSGVNAFSGDTHVTNGTLMLANSLALQNSALNLDGADNGTISFGTLTSATLGGLVGTRNLTPTNNSGAAVALTIGAGNTNTYAYYGSISGTGSVTKAGSGIFILNGSNTFTGILNVDTASGSANDGAIRIPSAAAIGNASLIQFRNNSGASAGSTLQLDGSAGSITVTTRVTASCRNSSQATIENLTGTNTFSAQITILEGGSLHNIVCDEGLLVFSSTNRYLGALTGGRTYVFSGAGDHLVSGPILNSTNGAPIGLTKSGMGRLTLAGVNTYGSNTAVNGGTLLVNGSITSAVAVASGATLGGSGSISNTVTISSGATLSPGSSVGTLTCRSGLVISNGAFLAYELGTNGDRTAVTGNLTIAGTLVVTDAGGFGAGDYTLLTFTGTLTNNGLTNNALPVGLNGSIVTSSSNVVLHVAASPPVASFTAMPTSGLAPLPVVFTDTSTNSPTSWAWDFDNNGITDSTDQNPTNTYAAGSYAVKLIACNAGGCSTSTFNSVNAFTIQQSWTNHYGVAADATDVDGDGVSNVDEFLAGFNPTNGAAYAHIIGIALTNGTDIAIQYLGADGDSSYLGGPLTRTNVLEYGSGNGSYTNDFATTGLTNILSGGMGLGTNVTVTELFSATNGPARYYRVRVLVP